MTQVDQGLAVQTVREVPAPQPKIKAVIWQALGLLALVALLYHQILNKLIQQWWSDPNFSHGFFVPLFSAYIIWQDRERLSQVPLRPAWSGLLAIIAALGVLFLGVFGADLFLSRSSLVLLLGGIVIYLFGWPMFRAVVFPWGFLILMVPLPLLVFNQITMPLQFLASKLAASCLPLAGVPVLREGNVIQLPSMSLEVAEACSGIRSLMSLGTLALMYGYFLEKSLVRRVLLALAAIPIAVAANAFRVVGTGLLVQYWDAEKALGFFHEFSGWIIFVISLALLFAVHRLIRLIPEKGQAA
jgi:exosortase